MLTIHRFLTFVEIVDCSCVGCGWADYEMEGKLYTQEGTKLIPA